MNMYDFIHDIIVDKLFTNLVMTRIPELVSVLLIAEGGKLIKNINPNSSERFDKTELEFIAKLIDLRYSIVGFDKILGGLRITVNVFRDYCIFVTRLNHNFTIAIITKNVDIEKTRQIIGEIKDECNFR